MACYKPLQAAYRLCPITGKKDIFFKYTDRLMDIFREEGKVPFLYECREGLLRTLSLPCGKCIGCRLEYSRQWAIRMMHEAQMHDRNCFITLTFDDDHLPADLSLDITVFQKFMKRLRKAYPNDKIRFYHCGEYGEKYGRPHYHAILFNFDFPDKRYFKKLKSGALYTSDKLSLIWPFGFSTIGAVTFDSAAYVARYITKKINGKDAAEHYKGRSPETCTMSRRPGIGSEWFAKYGHEVYPSDEVVVRGRSCKPPRYYDELYKSFQHESFEDIKKLREVKARTRVLDNTYDRLLVREKCKYAQLRKLERVVE